MYLPIYSFCIFFMNWFNDYIFQGVWKNRIRNGIIIISENNIPQNIWFFHNKFCGYANALFVISLSNSFMISSLSTWYKPKEKSELQFFFIAVMLGWNLYIMIAFINGLLMLWLIGFVSLYWRIHSFIMMLQKTSFNTDAVFLPFSTILSSSTKVIFWFETFLFDSKGLSTPQNFLLSHKSVSFKLPRNFLLLFRKKHRKNFFD